MSHAHSLTLSSLVSLALAGCTAPAPSGPYAYGPTEALTATLGGLPASHYPVPPESPRGDVTVTSFGIAHVELEGGVRQPLLHVRLQVSNEGDAAPWTMDSRRQSVGLPRFGRFGPAFANTDVAGAPVVTVARGEKRVIDLYYPLPPGAASEAKLASFDLVWEVETGLRLVTERTPFERRVVDGAYDQPEASVWLGLGWGPVWWRDPFYPGVVVGPPVIRYRHYHHPTYAPRPGPGPGPGAEVIRPESKPGGRK